MKLFLGGGGGTTLYLMYKSGFTDLFFKSGNFEDVPKIIDH